LLDLHTEYSAALPVIASGGIGSTGPSKLKKARRGQRRTQEAYWQEHRARCGVQSEQSDQSGTISGACYYLLSISKDVDAQSWRFVYLICIDEDKYNKQIKE